MIPHYNKSKYTEILKIINDRFQGQQGYQIWN